MTDETVPVEQTPAPADNPVPVENSSQMWTHLAILIAVVLVCYVNSVRGVFVLDDRAAIERNPSIRSYFPDEKSIPVCLHHRPVGRWSLTWNFSPDPKTRKLSPVGFHLTNIFIHLAAATALYFLVRDTLRWLEKKRTDLADLPDSKLTTTAGFALAVAVIWMVHPLQTESVTYITQRLESLMGLFFLLTLYCLLRGATSSPAWAWYLGSVVTMWLSVGSKEVGAMALPVALLFDRTFLSTSWSELFRKRGLVYVGLLTANVWLGYELATFKPASNDAGLFYTGISRWDYLATQPQILLHYLRLTVWPQTLVMDYDWPIATSALQIYPAGLLILGLLAASFYAWRKYPPLGFLGLSFFFILAPTSSIVPSADLAFEHRMYLPLAALVVLGVIAVHRAWQKFEEISPATDADHMQSRKLCLILLVVAVALPLAARTIRRNADYRSKNTLYASDLKYNPNNQRVLFNYSTALVSEEGKFEEAIEHLSRLLELNPKHARAFHLRGACRYEMNDFDGALADQTRAIELDGKLLHAYLRRGELHSRFGRTEEAIKDLTAALELDSRQPVPLLLRAETHQKTENYDAAEKDCTLAIEINERQTAPVAFYRRGLVRVKLNNLDGALADFDEAIKRNADLGPAYAERAKLLFQKEEYEAAWDDVQTSQELGEQTELEFFRKLRAIVQKKTPAAEENTSIAP